MRYVIGIIAGVFLVWIGWVFWGLATTLTPAELSDIGRNGFRKFLSDSDIDYYPRQTDCSALSPESDNDGVYVIIGCSINRDGIWYYYFAALSRHGRIEYFDSNIEKH